jgi:hypothetical protein
MSVKPKLPGMAGGKMTGSMRGKGHPEKFDKPHEVHSDTIEGMGGMHNDIGEKSGFQDSGYIDKKDTAYGESAKFNKMPPGMDIENQESCDIRAMPFKKVVDISYPGDGWEPTPSYGSAE